MPRTIRCYRLVPSACRIQRFSLARFCIFFIRFLSFVDSVAGRLSFYSHFLPLRFAFISVLSALRASDSFPTLCLYAITAFLIWKHLELISKTLIEMRTQRDITESAQRNRRTQANSKVNANVR